ncbi:hypothetical protein EXIGLDRAFT_267860 [Exidia glandulosa HHB12029]|uniref:G-protein coupled receptors family 2 profile 2 domain-containing protein n=1 Tax=Exidia glandulosa HHB12029 TaxID=1314781 RepID=A0A165MCB5_EXIGL|nr:hypothetical protein EXIGLDRAFT_267860 [Exidia glandulosa HHB12029]
MPNRATLNATTGQIVAFFVLCNIGQILLLAFLATAFLSTSIKRRDGTVLNLCASMALWAIGANLLLYAGHFPTGHYEPHEPQFPICLAQAVIIYTSISAAATSVFALVLHLWFSVHFTSLDSMSRWRGPFLVGLPWFIGGIMFIVSLARGLQARDTVILARDAVYCSVGDPVFVLSHPTRAAA